MNISSLLSYGDGLEEEPRISCLITWSKVVPDGEVGGVVDNR
jgi:hypothetical protein